MKSREAASGVRNLSYGEERKFRGLEAYAIRKRLKAAHRVLDLLIAEKPGREHEVLELGCGFWGANLIALNEHYPGIRFTGVDLSVTNEKSQVRLIQADISTWSPSRKYDAVLSLAVAEHLIDPQRHFDLIADCLTEGGMAGLTTPAPQAHAFLWSLAGLGIFDRAEIKDHKLYITETGLREMAANSKLSVEEFRPFSLGLNQWALMRKR